MSQGIPKLKASELLTRIISLSNNDISNPFIINGIRREIDVLKKTNASQAYAVEGQLAFLLGDFDFGRSAFQRSLALDQFDTVVLNNYGAALSQAGLHQEAYEAYVVALEIGSEPILSLDGMALSSLAMFHLDEASKVELELLKMSPDNKEYIHRHTTTLDAIDFFEENNISQSEGSRLMEVVWETLISQKVLHEVFSLAHLRSADAYDFVIYVDQLPNVIADINMNISMNLAERNIESSIVDKLIVSCMPIHEAVLERHIS